MLSSPLLAEDRTWLPPRLRRWLSRGISGPPRGRIIRRYRAGVFQLDRLGDAVLASSAIRSVLEAFGPAESLLVVSRAAAPLIEREFPHVDRIVLPVNAPSFTRDLVPTAWRFRREFRGRGCEHLVCLSHHRDLYKSTALSWIATAHLHLLDRNTYPVAAPEGQCLELEAHRRLLSRVLGREVGPAEVLPRLSSVESRPGGELVVCPLASERVRHLPDELLIGALRCWRARSAAPIVFCGPPESAAELERLQSVSIAAGLAPASVDLTRSFDAFLHRIAHAGAVLAVESAPGHLATALDKDACIVTGGGRFGLCAPWRRSSRQVHVSHHVPCFGCGWKCHQPEVYCVTRIAPQSIADALPAL